MPAGMTADARTSRSSTTAAGATRASAAHGSSLSMTMRVLSSCFESASRFDARFVLVGYRRNGNEGVQFVEAVSPDVVLTSLHVPVLDGISATREIVARDPDACVVAFTSS